MVAFLSLVIALGMAGSCRLQAVEPIGPGSPHPTLGLQQMTCGMAFDPAKKDSLEYRETAGWLEASAQGGRAVSQFYFGVIHHLGIGVEKNEAEALRWYKLAAEQGRRTAAYNVGVCYYEGQGTPRNVPEAIRWFRLAANEGFAPAKELLDRIQAPPSQKGQNQSSEGRKPREDAHLAVEPEGIPGSEEIRKTFQGHSYVFVPRKTTWRVAEENARERGGYLASIGSSEENDFLRKMVTEAGRGGPIEVWIGLNNDNEEEVWKWSDGNSLKFSSWAQGEPNNAGGYETAVIFGKRTALGPSVIGKWNDMPSAWKAYSIVELDKE